MNSQVIQVFIPFFLVFYFFAGIASVKTDRLYPIDAWTLYVKVPNKTQSVTLRIHTKNENNRISSVLLRDFRDYSYKLDNPIVETISILETALKSDDHEKIRELEIKLGNDPILQNVSHYELVKLTYDPLDRWKNGRYHIESIKHFYRNRD